MVRGFLFFLLSLSHFSFSCAVGSDFKIAICGGNFFIGVSGEMEGRFDYCFGVVGWAGVLCDGLPRVCSYFSKVPGGGYRESTHWRVVGDIIPGILWWVRECLLALRSAIFLNHGL